MPIQGAFHDSIATHTTATWHCTLGNVAHRCNASGSAAAFVLSPKAVVAEVRQFLVCQSLVSGLKSQVSQTRQTGTHLHAVSDNNLIRS